MLELSIDQDRTNNLQGTILAADGSPVALADGDALRFKIGRTLAVPLVDLSSEAATDNGSVITITSQGNDSQAATYTVLIDQGDLSQIVAGSYDAEISVVDASDSGRIKVASKGICHVLLSMSGGLS